jgi:hypothetical protein
MRFEVWCLYLNSSHWHAVQGQGGTTYSDAILTLVSRGEIPGCFFLGVCYAERFDDRVIAPPKQKSWTFTNTLLYNG